MYFVYLLECSTGGRSTIYIGITTDVARRLAEHKSGKGAHYTRARIVKKVLYTESYPNRSAASKREAELKKFRRADKLKLIHESRRSKDIQ